MRNEFLVHNFRHKLENYPNRKEALKTGNRFYRGKPCKNGHIGIRYTESCKCIDCVAALQRNLRKKKSPLNTSKAIAVDHILESKERDYWDDI